MSEELNEIEKERKPEKPAWTDKDQLIGLVILIVLWVIIPIGLFLWGGLPFVVFYALIWLVGFFILCMLNPCM
jgi:uncharacterized membrane protein